MKPKLPSKVSSSNLSERSELEAQSPPNNIESSTWLGESQSSFKTGLKWISGSGILLVVLLGGWFAYQNLPQQSPKSIAVRTNLVKSGDIEVTITESGLVELGGQQTFKAPSDVTVQEVRVKERQRVKAGTVLLALRDRRLQQELQNQQVKNLQDKNTENRRREVVIERQKRLKDAEDRLADAKSLLAQGFISEDEFRTDKNAMEDALSSVKDAQVELANATLTVRNNQLNTNSLRTQLQDNKIVTPFEAVILKVEVKPGDGVQQEGRLLTIGDPNQEMVRVQLTTLNATKTKLNMPVKVSVIGPNPRPFLGRISRVSPQAIVSDKKATSGNSSTPATVEAEIRLTQPSEGELIPGSAVSVEVILDRRQNVLTVPLAALQTSQGSTFVWVKDTEGRAEQRQVKTGIQNLQVIEIVSGLLEGDEVVIVPTEQVIISGTPLESTMRIRPGKGNPEQDNIPLRSPRP